MLCHMSTDYYSRLERGRGPHPSEQMIASIAQGLHLSLKERDHLYRLAGHHPPARGVESEHISPGMLRVFDRLDDTPAEIVTELGETLRQNALGVALTGDSMRYSGVYRSIGYRWFADPDFRSLYATEDHDFLGRLFASGLRELVGLRGPHSHVARLADRLLVESAEFRTVWALQEVGILPNETKRFIHPELGLLELTCQTLQDPTQSHSLLVYTAEPGSDSYDKLQLLSVIGAHPLG